MNVGGFEAAGTSQKSVGSRTEQSIKTAPGLKRFEEKSSMAK